MMSRGKDNPNNDLAFSSRCLPGSAAEQKEQQRVEEFQRLKAEEDRIRRAAAEQRHQAYLEYYEANKERFEKEEAAKLARRSGWVKR